MTKQSRLALGQDSPAFKWSGNQIVGTGRNRPFETLNGPGFGCLVYSQHPKTRFLIESFCLKAKWSSYGMVYVFTF